MEPVSPAPRASANANAAVSLHTRLYRIRRLLKRAWWVPLLTVSAALCLQAFLIFREPPAYESHGQMWVSGKISLPEGGVWRDEVQNFFGTQSELLRSGLLQKRTYDRLRIMKPNLAPCEIGLQVAQKPRAAVFVLRAVGEEPVFTQAFLDTHMEEYLNYKRELRDKSAEEAVAGLKQQLYGPEKELREATERRIAFQQANNLALIEQLGSSAGGSLAKYNAQLNDLRSQLQLAELLAAEPSDEKASSLIEGVLSTDGKRAEAGSALAGYQKAREQLMLFKAERAEWGRYLKPKHPKIIKMDDEISRQERLLEIFRQQGRDQLISARDSLRIQVRGLEEQVRDWETKAAEASRKINEYEQLKANEERLKSAYEKLLNWLQTVGLTKNLDPENVSVMERAAPATPVKSSLVKRLGVAGFLGLALGLGILWFVDRHDDRITSVAELMEQFEAPVMGHVPSLQTGKSELIELVHSADERHAFVESFRDIRSALLFSNPDGSHPQVLLITSSVPNEGKSAVSANLAVTMALAGSRVLLVDADMRCATVHRYFGVGAEPGLSEILTEQVHYSEAIKQTATPNLSLISSGRPVTNAGELFLHPNTGKLVNELRGQFDMILFDSPPVLATADTPSLAPKTDGVLFVVRAGFTSARLVRNSLALLGQRRVSILGTVLNRADSANPGYYQYKYAKYYKTPKPAVRA